MQKNLPRIVFQTWKTNQIPEKWQAAYLSWSNFCKEYNFEHVLWTDEQNREFIASEYPWFLTQYDNYKYPIMRADVVRYFFSYHYGCIYVDLDIGIKPEKYDQLNKLILFYGAMHDVAIPITKNAFWKDTLTNSFFIGAKGNEFMKKVFETLQHPELYHWTSFKNILTHLHKFHILFLTGPGIFSDTSLLNPHLLVQIPVDYVSDGDSDVCVFEHETGGSWHDDKQMTSDILKLAGIGSAIALFVLFFIILFICTAVKIAKK